ncbi:NAD-P-binding protein [Auriscalpium vulgare]|uniref:NAD-P-binding protein n=1 Tax=Auriscalpium vulgare TaxID=40419 RepID=A0ACB8RSL0_9AGAM|nr:NAD-P-binding protein [Auriscalpium vulgare]
MLQTVYRLKNPGQGPRGIVRGQAAIPTPRAHEVLVRIHAVSLNYRDIAIATNAYGVSIKADVIPAGDLAGEVVSAGEAVGDFKKGDRVVSISDQNNIYGNPATVGDSLGWGIDGGLAEYIVLPGLSLLHIPTHLSYEEASCFPTAGVTAWNALYGGLPLIPGQTVLFQGTGGVSIFGLLIAHAAGAKACAFSLDCTIVTSSSDEKLELAKKLGADYIINYKKTPDWDKVARELTNGRGVDHIFDNAGINDIQRSFNAVVRGGTISAIGFLGGKPKEYPDVPLLAIFSGCTLRGINVGSKQLFENLLRFFETKELKPYIDKVFPFDEAVEAFEYLESGQHVGKVVVRITG